MWRYTIVFIFMNLSAMHHSPATLDLPREIVISDEHGLVERIPTGQQAIEREMSQWVIREMLQQNTDLRAQLEATKHKWYVITAGIATTVIPLVICGVELYNLTQDCE